MGQAEVVIVGVIYGGQVGCVEEGSVGMFFYWSLTRVSRWNSSGAGE